MAGVRAPGIASKIAAYMERRADRLRCDGDIRTAARYVSVAAWLEPNCRRFERLGELMLDQGNPTGALVAFSRARRMPSFRPSAELALRETWAHLRSTNLQAAVVSLQEAVALGAGSLEYALGSLLARLGRFAEADAIFAKDLTVPLGNGGETRTRAIRLLPVAESGVTQWARRLSFGRPAAPPEGGWRARYVVASDSIYFCRYAAFLASSIRQAGSGVMLHVHLINPDASALLLYDKLIAENSFIIGSTETVDLSGLNDSQKSCYYSANRYLLLSDIFDSSEVPIIVADIDQLLMADISPLIQLGRNADVGVIYFDHQHSNILSLISATVLLVMPTSAARIFVNRLEQYIQELANSPMRLVWHIDQAALAVVYLTRPDVIFVHIPPEMIHLGPGEPLIDNTPGISLFWSITNSIEENLDKLKTASFQKFAS